MTNVTVTNYSDDAYTAFGRGREILESWLETELDKLDKLSPENKEGDEAIAIENTIKLIENFLERANDIIGDLCDIE